MAKREVLTFICDNCGSEVCQEAFNLLPIGWTDIMFIQNDEPNEPIQVCEICTDAVAKALAERRHAPSE